MATPIATIVGRDDQGSSSELQLELARQGRPRPRRWPRPEPNRGERSSDSLALVGELDELHRASAPRAPHHVDREHPL
ncbi:hypothetical protein DB30_03237 [Enhygromyxa salina]|uniref:Uncharacterized protein n=1 Tax=Enhygromyxa salina TaxID=215803 RepID=A0A0C2D2N8_9BACT|nr:hypothetical protein DB30_03237 [Enhygromyxa salina]